MKNWPTKKQDLLLAQSIINKHVDFNDGVFLELYEFIVENRLEFTSNSSEWLVELTDLYKSQYGTKTGTEILKKVLSTCMINGAVIH